MAKEEVLHEAEAWAVGKRDGVPVSEDDDTYHNNSKWYSDQAAISKTAASASQARALETRFRHGMPDCAKRRCSERDGAHQTDGRG